ncbi:DUF5116 domain-containing protein [Vibrio sp. 10N.286.49.B3]|uniref:pullulanase-type alpha-1,6-glucosidase n=1 Tax=Vibrio sp. 10N.286.49.B3 TaxID=1880855 RepID=UPI000C84D706|nr:pullulanase-type alpha-1,6-glucosidase [Vibrio sp. 10N.286.49.B3]PMH46591.1 DUF5116 domain-containing protein [Vibrio sp. 10N.286.49.B3]
MEMKISTLAKLTMPLLVSALVVGCGGSDDNPQTPGDLVDGLYPAADNEVVIYYKRDDAQTRSGDSVYNDWGLHLWNGEGCTSTDLEAMGLPAGGTDWNSPYLFKGISDTYGAYYVIKFDPMASDPHKCMNFILHKGDDKGFGSANQKVHLERVGDSKGLFGFHGSSELYYVPTAERPVLIDGQKAHWLDETTIAWESIAGADSVELRYDLNNKIVMDAETKELEGGEIITLSAGSISDELKAKFPHLSGLSAAEIDVDSELLHTILKSQIVLAAYDSDGKTLAATEVQKPGVLDDVFVEEEAGNAINETLGAIVSGTDAEFKLWAPTAQNVSLTIYDYVEGQHSVLSTHEMTEDPNTGIWQSESISDVVDKFYRYTVTVYHPTTKEIETREVTDPYSLSLSMNSLYSHVVDLENDELLKPADWDNYTRPEMNKDIDHILYESHIRDFSFSDTKGQTGNQGKYLALTESDRESVQHLQALADAGLTTLHILPAFDIATVDENPQTRVEITDSVEKLCSIKPDATVCDEVGSEVIIEDLLTSYDPTTTDAQALMNDLRALDGFNWGYDPFHYTVPEGSYASDAQGSARIKEFREMVKATHDMGLKLIMDVVYNHTNASGINDKSVLDKIVPGYYHRLDANTGGVEQSTCCDNTATENLMMGKLMIDSLKVWAQEYNVDGFRFDLMGHQPKDLMVEALEEVRKIDSGTLFYGEGWDFGEVAQNARFTQATQIEMAGTEIGTFSDRLRDGVRGGSPFDDGTLNPADNTRSIRKNQGFANAAYLNDNNSDEAAFRDSALHNQDLIRLGMAGNLADYLLIDSNDELKYGKQVDYNGAPAGYTMHPSENISYVSKHDNQTLWDNNAYKADYAVTNAEKARMQTVALSTVMLGQGIPFIHMGSELLRSKSMQRDSYDSGDWFNRVRFDGSDNNWNVGLPREDKDGSNYDLIKEILNNAPEGPTALEIEAAKQQFFDLLSIRSGSELFRLETADEVKDRVDFRNVGKEQTRGLIVMSIDDGTLAGADLDPNYDAVVVVINATSEEQVFNIENSLNFELHDVQQSSADSIVKEASFDQGNFTVPALTTAVFVQPQNGEQGAGLPIDGDKDESNIPPYGSTTVYVKGDMNGWGDDEDFALSFTGKGIYTLSTPLEVGEYSFKFADSSWSAPDIGCSPESTEQADGSMDLGVDGNCKVTIEEAGSYSFTLDASYVNSNSIEKPVVSVVKE